MNPNFVIYTFINLISILFSVYLFFRLFEVNFNNIIVRRSYSIIEPFLKPFRLILPVVYRLDLSCLAMVFFFKALGFYISGHPYEEYEDEIRNLAVTPIGNLRADAAANQTCAGVIVSLRVMRTKRGNLAIFLIDDRSARIEVTADSEIFERQRQLLTKP